MFIKCFMHFNFNATFGHFEQRKEFKDHFLRPAAYNLENRPEKIIDSNKLSFVTNHLLEVHLLVNKMKAMRTHGHLALLALEFLLHGASHKTAGLVTTLSSGNDPKSDMKTLRNN